MKDKKKKKGMFAIIDSHEAALKTIKECSIVFFIVAVIQAGIGISIEPARSLIFDGALYAVLAGIMLKWNSRIAAVCLLSILCYIGYMTIINRSGWEGEGGMNIIWVIILIWPAIRAVEATFKINGKYDEPSYN